MLQSASPAVPLLVEAGLRRLAELEPERSERTASAEALIPMVEKVVTAATVLLPVFLAVRHTTAAAAVELPTDGRKGLAAQAVAEQPSGVLAMLELRTPGAVEAVAPLAVPAAAVS